MTWHASLLLRKAHRIVLGRQESLALLLGLTQLIEKGRRCTGLLWLDLRGLLNAGWRLMNRTLDRRLDWRLLILRLHGWLSWRGL